MSNPVGPTYYADFSGLEGLKKDAKTDDQKAVRAVAQQFESLFTNMMLKSMRDAKIGSGMGDSQESDMYQDMYDQQIALKMSQGKGLGLADMLVAQLTRNRAAKAAAGAQSGAASSTSGSTPTGASAITGAGGSASDASSAVSHDDRISFVKRMEPYAQQAAAQLGVSPDAVIAQAALETGWGQHVPAAGGASSSNLFGIKAGNSWSGGSVTALTTEVDQGSARTLPQAFRAYDGVQQGVNDYVSLLQSSRYRSARNTGSDVAAFANGLARGGYATDPNYVQKLQATAAAVKTMRSANSTDSLKLLAGLPTTGGGEA
ncbi:MAG TPA: flagellar assembly peptidoglycan hydrolase FlgJ [Steroidobacteraceae bacterium]|jgi:flagellar protein FlgJ|nr:flagellar assembly peptidoglycan hydrolase FlgJ [Steroidobacteraceae bacterium]